jgi:hypothetical protein
MMIGLRRMIVCLRQNEGKNPRFGADFFHFYILTSVFVYDILKMIKIGGGIMRRIKMVLLLFLTVITLFFVACAPEKGAESEITEEDAPTTVAGEEALADEFKPLNEKAKAYIAQKYGRKALDFLVLESAVIVDEPRSKFKGLPELVYLIDVYGYDLGRFEFTFDAEGGIARHFEMNDEPLAYCEMLTKEKVERAAARIAKQAGKPLEGRDYYFFIDDQNYLCIGTEIIVEFDELQPDGSIMHDHKHVFYKERLAIFIRDLFDLFE